MAMQVYVDECLKAPKCFVGNITENLKKKIHLVAAELH
jgi:hypothetical protein